jgi:ATP-dependent helicase/nuclease subunit A
MTVHASKGLEFPVVFVVNLAHGTGNRRDPIRVAIDGPDGTAASVAVGDFQSDADEDGAAREREETKRLLYVALTRARDRLYLGSVLKDGRLQPGRGSLADVLPPSLAPLFAETAAAGEGSVSWSASSGVAHRFRVCSASDAPPAVTPEAAPVLLDDFDPVDDRSVPRRAIGDVIIGDPATARVADPGDVDRLVGTLVHRLLDRFGLDPERETVGTGFPGLSGVEGSRLLICDTVPQLLRPEELAEAEDINALIERVVKAYRAVCRRAEVRTLYAGGERYHEVPFTMDTGDIVLRGTIDCLVRQADGRITLLEFKTGSARPEHRAQVQLYRRAAQHLFPAAEVDALLIYADEALAG